MGGQRTIEHLLSGLRHADRALGDPGDSTHARRSHPESAPGSTESAPACRRASTVDTGTATAASGAGPGWGATTRGSGR